MHVKYKKRNGREQKINLFIINIFFKKNMRGKRKNFKNIQQQKERKDREREREREERKTKSKD